MNKKGVTRRSILGRSADLSLMGLALWAVTGCDKRQMQAACYDPEQQLDKAGLRRSLQYTEASTDSNSTCSGCAFFKAQADQSCGRCDIFSGPVNPRGHCNSWSRKTSEGALDVLSLHAPLDNISHT